MNFKSLLAVGFSIATVALSLPARADQATVIQTTQDATLTGKNNVSTQRNATGVINYERSNKDNSGTAIGTSQRTDLFGEGNRATQENKNAVGNVRVRNR
jgi:hypothetical protein